MRVMWKPWNQDENDDEMKKWKFNKQKVFLWKLLGKLSAFRCQLKRFWRLYVDVSMWKYETGLFLIWVLRVFDDLSFLVNDGAKV